jgi:arylformamidase
MPSTERLIDISVPIQTGMLVFPDDPPVELEPQARIADGDPVNVTSISIGTHTGTHIDAQWHFIDDGARLSAIALERLIGPCLVVDFSDRTADIDAQALDSAPIPNDTTRLLLKTRNSQFWDTDPTSFREDYVGVSHDGARWLADRGIDFVGIDYLTVEPWDSDGETHQIMLRANMVILETIDLREVEPGAYTVYCLPLRIDDADGAPSRVLLEPAR